MTDPTTDIRPITESEFDLLRHEWPTLHTEPPLCLRCGAHLKRDAGYCRGKLALLLAEARALRIAVERLSSFTVPPEVAEAEAERLLSKLHEPFYRLPEPYVPRFLVRNNERVP